MKLLRKRLREKLIGVGGGGVRRPFRVACNQKKKKERERYKNRKIITLDDMTQFRKRLETQERLKQRHLQLNWFTLFTGGKIQNIDKIMLTFIVT